MEKIRKIIDYLKGEGKETFIQVLTNKKYYMCCVLVLVLSVVGRELNVKKIIGAFAISFIMCFFIFFFKD